MKTYSPIVGGCLLAFAGICSAPAVQAADDSGWYVGAGVGRSQATDLDSIDGTLAGYGITSLSSVGDTDTAWKLYGGYQFNKYFGTELGYHDLGRFDVNSNVTAPAAGAGTGTWDVNNVWSLAAVGTLPINDQFSAFGKLGAAYSKVDFNFASPGAIVSTSNNSTSPYYGAGLKYDFTRNVAVRGEFERFQDVGDNSTTGQSSINVWSLGLQYKF